MAKLTSELFVRLIDGATRPARGIANAILGIGNATNSVTGRQGFGQRLADASARADAGLNSMRGKMFDAVAAGYALTRAISSPVRAAMDFESAMADVNKVVDFGGAAGLEKFKAELIDLSKRVPVSVDGLAQIAAAAGQAGFAAEDILKVTEAAATLGVAFDITAEKAGDAIPKLQNSMGLTLDEVMKLADAMNHLSNAQASSAGDILEVTTKVGAYAKQAGFSAVETAALASSMLSTGQEVDVVATSIRNLGLYLGKGVAATKAQKTGFAALGLEAEDVSEKMQVDAMGTFADILERINKLPAHRRGAVSSQIFGNESRALGPLIANLDLLPKSLALIASESDYAGSAIREFEVRAKTFANAVEIWDNRIYALKVSIGNALIPALTSLIDKMSPVVEAITDYAAAHPELTRNVIAAGAALVGFRVAVTALSYAGLIGRASALSALAKAFSLVAPAARNAKAALALQTALAGGANITGMMKLGTAIKGIALAIPGFGLLGPALTTIGTALAGISAPVVAGIVAIASAGLLIWKYWDRLSSIFSGVASVVGDLLAPAFESAKAKFEWMAPLGKVIADSWNGAMGVLKAVGDFLGGLFSQEVLTDAEKAQMRDAGRKWAQELVDGVVEKVTWMIDWFKELPSAILRAIGRIDVGSLINWGTPPSWWTAMTGGQITAPVPGNGGHTLYPVGQGPTDVPKYAKGGGMDDGDTVVVGDGGEPEYFTAGADGFVTPFSTAAEMAGSHKSAPESKGSAGAGPITLVIQGSVYGVEDLERRFRQFAADLRREYERERDGGFSDNATT